MKEVLLLARDPGGANTVMPVAEALQEQGYTVRLFGKDMALARFRQAGLISLDIYDYLPAVTIDDSIYFLQMEKPDFIITGTSAEDFSERFLWAAAAHSGIPSFAILDQWINYGIRFSPYSLLQDSEYQHNKIHSYLPDRILVMDEEARQGTLAEGIEPDRILVSGQPYFDLLHKKMNERQNKSSDHMLRVQLGCKPEDFIVLFISEPISRVYGSADNPNGWGYTEKSICTDLLLALESIAARYQGQIICMIKQHPREAKGSFNEIIQEFADSPLGIRIINTEMDSWGLLETADLVAGMSSMLLQEAIYWGRSVISIQIGLNRESPFVLERRGLLSSLRSREELQNALERIILDKQDIRVSCKPSYGAVSRIIELMEEFTCRI